MLLPSVGQYYLMTIQFGPSSGRFELPVVFAAADVYSGNGSEFGGVDNPERVLAAVANGIGSSLAGHLGQSWSDPTLVSIQAQPVVPVDIPAAL